MRLIVLGILICLHIALMGSQAAKAERRVALVIGNSKYVHAPELANPRNDAVAVAAALKRLNFEVVLALDVTQAEAARPISEFVSLLDGADVALLFYAGHGLSFEGQNYLVPIDASVESAVHVKFQMTPIDRVVEEMQVARLNIVILDACRDNPLAAQLARSLGTSSRSTSVGRGLTRMKSPAKESFILFATAPGDVAADGQGEHSPFTAALLSHIEKKGMTIEDVLRDVRRDVREATRGRQLPEGWVRLERRFLFKPGASDTATEAPSTATSNEGAGREAEDRVYWESVRDLGDAQLLKSYIDEFPDGKYVEIARRLIAKLSTQTAVTPPAGGSASGGVNAAYDAAVGAGTDAALEQFVSQYPDDPRAKQLKKGLAERHAWAAALSADSQAGYERYLLVYPSGIYAAAARDRIAALIRPSESSRATAPPAAPATNWPSETVAPSFNCLEDTGAAEQTICANAGLARLDLQVASSYAILRGRLSSQDGRVLRDTQRAWIKSRDACQWDASCIEQRYLYRLQELRAWGG